MLRNPTHLALALAITSGCAVQEDADSVSTDETDLAAAVPSFTLHTSAAPFSSVTVSHTAPNGKIISEVCNNPCDLGFVSGTALTIRVTFPSRIVDCIQFGKWNESPCAGQGPTCHTTIHGNIVATAAWVPIRGCVGQ